MLHYQNILLAVDLHPSCDELITQRAIEIAKLYHAKLSIVHVVERLPVYGPGIAYAADIEDQLFKDAKVALNNLATKYDILPTQQIIARGPPRLVILEQAKKLNTDLIVIGSHGRHGIALLLGSTANAVLHQAQCDVLVIRVKKQ